MHKTTEETTREYINEKIDHIKEELKVVNVYGQHLTGNKDIQNLVSKIYTRLNYIKCIIKD